MIPFSQRTRAACGAEGCSTAVERSRLGDSEAGAFGVAICPMYIATVVVAAG